MLKKEQVARFLKANSVKKRKEFETIFALGNYDLQNQDLEKFYQLENGNFFTIVDSQEKYAYISIFDSNEMQYFDGYITFKKYNELVEKNEK